jgi:hypothetical protein
LLSLAAGIIFVSAQAPKEAETPEVALGQPGLSYRLVSQLGVTNGPYFSDLAHLNQPFGLVASGNAIWIGEMMGDRIIKFGSDGSYLGVQIGKAGAYTDHPLSWVSDLALDSSGNVWIASTDASYVVAYDASGNFVKQLGQPWEYGTSNDRFGNPSGVAFDSKGNVYISDGAMPWVSGNHRIQIYSSSDAYINTIGETGVSGTDNSHFNSPTHIAIDSQDQLYVADRENHRVQVYDVSNPLSPTYIATIGVTGECSGASDHLCGPHGVAVDANYIYIADSWNTRVQIFNRATRAYVSTIGDGSPNYDFNTTTDVAVDATGNIYVADPVNARVMQYNSNRIYSRVYGTKGVPYLTDGSHFNGPHSLARTPDNGFLIIENVGQRLIKLDSTGTPQWTIGTPGVGGDDNQHFGWPQDVTVDTSGNIYVADNNNMRIQIYNSNGSYYASIGSPSSQGTGNYQFNYPHGVAVAADGKIYVADRYNHRVQVFDSNRNYLATMGETGVANTDNAHFNQPMDVLVDSAGNIYVADSGNNRVQVFNSSRAYVRSIGEVGVSGDNFGQFRGGMWLTVDLNDHLFVSSDNWTVQVFDSSGVFLTSIGSGGNQGDPANLGCPAGMIIDKDDNLYLTEGCNFRIQIFSSGVPGWKQANINGFGDRWNEHVFSLEEFNGQLYAGTGNWSSGATVWRSNTGTDWTQVSLPRFSNIYTDTNVAIIDMIVFNNQLYAGTAWSGFPGQIWRSSNGTTWEQVTADGFGNANNIGFESFTIIDGQIYVSTHNQTDGLEIWRSTDGNSWSKVVTGGNGNKNNAYVGGIAEFSGAYFAATENIVDGAEIWQSTNGTTWNRIVTGGFGAADNRHTASPVEFKGTLFVGTYNTTSGAQLWKTTNGTVWAPVMQNGFGDVRNEKIEMLRVYQNELYVFVNNSLRGGQVWQSNDGDLWKQVSVDGFGDSNNVSTLGNAGSAIFKNNFYVGISNTANGGEIWQMLHQVYLPLVLKNFQTSTASQWRVVSSPTSKNLNGLFMVSANDGWVVGNDGTILRWNGSQWSAFTSPTTSHLQAVKIVSASDGWAVGNGGTILRWNGSAWNTVSSPTFVDLYDVKMISGSNGWAVGNGGVTLRWNGTAWSLVTSPTNRDLRALDFINASDGWAVGGMWDAGFGWYQNIVLHWNGTNWIVDPAINIQPDVLETVDFISSTDGWVAGQNNIMNRRVGSNWTSVSGHPTITFQYSLDQLSANEVWVVGWVFSKENIARWDGNTWKTFIPPTTDNVALYAIDMLSSNEGWAVGESGTIIRYSP